MPFPAHLSDAAIEEIGREFDALREEVIQSRGEQDRRYFLGVVRLQRGVELSSRLVILLSLAFLPGWDHAAAGWGSFLLVIALGTFMLACAKLLSNLEVGHNLMHGQWDWMRDPDFNSTTFEWDMMCPSPHWKHLHNVMHHRWANVVGKDRDLGFSVLRVTDQQPWSPSHLAQPFALVALGVLFEWFISVHDLEINRVVSGERSIAELRPMFRRIGRKVAGQGVKDYVMWPLLAGPFFFYVVAANVVANCLRNLWSFTIVLCNHFPEGAHLFTVEDVQNETRGRWYLRQLLGSCNVEGGWFIDLISGNINNHIEHHLFPDLPSNRYRELSPRVRALCARYDLPYNASSLRRHLGTAVMKLLRLSLPHPRSVWR